MNRIRARWWMDARWHDKLTGSSVTLDDVWKWRVIVIAWCAKMPDGQRRGKPVNQMKGYDVERKVAEWKSNDQYRGIHAQSFYLIPLESSRRALEGGSNHFLIRRTVFT